MIIWHPLTFRAVDVVKSRIQMHSTGEWYVRPRRHLALTDSLLQDVPRACTDRTRGRSRRIVQGYAPPSTTIGSHLTTIPHFQVSRPRFFDWRQAVVSSSSVRLLIPEWKLPRIAHPFHLSRRSIVNRLPKELGSPLRLIAGQKRRYGSKTGIEVYRNRVVGLHRVLYGLESACMTSLHLGQGNGLVDWGGMVAPACAQGCRLAPPESRRLATKLLHRTTRTSDNVPSTLSCAWLKEAPE